LLADRPAIIDHSKPATRLIGSVEFRFHRLRALQRIWSADETQDDVGSFAECGELEFHDSGSLFVVEEFQI